MNKGGFMSFFGSSPIKLSAGRGSLSLGHSDAFSGGSLLHASTSSNIAGSSLDPLAQVVIQALSQFNLPYTVCNVDQGEEIYQEGDIAQGVYLLKTGCIKICVHRENTRGRTTTSEYVTKLVSPGEVFGYKAIIANTPLRSFARAVRPSTYWLYPKAAILDVLSQSHPLILSLLRQAVADIENYEKMSQLHYLASVQERIAYQLVVLADRFGVMTSKGIGLNLKLTRNEFAQLASTINESLSRHLTEVKNEGLIELNGKEIIILDRKRLAAKSGNF